MTPDTTELRALAALARSGKRVALTEKLANELLDALDLLEAPDKTFEPALYSNVVLIDAHYEGHPTFPSREAITLVVGAGRFVRRIKLPAGLALGLCDVIRDAIPQDGEDDLDDVYDL